MASDKTPGYSQRVMNGNTGSIARVTKFPDGNEAVSVNIGVHIPIKDEAGKTSVDPKTGYTVTDTAWVQIRPTKNCKIADSDGTLFDLRDLPTGTKIEAAGGYSEETITKNGRTFNNRILRANAIKVVFFPTVKDETVPPMSGLDK